MLVPAAMEELNESHAALGQPARQNAVGRVGARLARIGAVEFEGGLRLFRQVRQLGHRRFASGTPSRTARCASRSPGPDIPAAVIAFSFARSSRKRRRASARIARRVRQIQHRIGAGAELHALVLVGRKPLPHCAIGQRLRVAAALRHHHHERRQILDSRCPAHRRSTSRCSAAPPVGIRSGRNVTAGS